MVETQVPIVNNETVELFWGDLLAYIEERKVIPVLGRELITVTIDNEEIPLYRAIARVLLESNGLTDNIDVVLRPHQELNDAVAALIGRGKRVQDLYRPINDSLNRIIRQSSVSSEVLSDLAGIANFDLFITTTFDDLFINTLNRIRNNGAKSAESIIYAPTNLTGNARCDIPEIIPQNYQAVLYLFGRASASSVYAIHDEDTLEFMYNLLARSSWIPERMIAEVLNRNLLLIGCNFSDWLIRFFIRLSNRERLSRGDRVKKEFLVGNDMSHEQSLTVLLENFSQNSRLYPCDAKTFVKELSMRWRERNPPAENNPVPVQVAQSTEIFISYSHFDLAAARTLHNEIKDLGADIPWFDKEQIKPGDEWDKKIMTAINRCKYFIPVLSSVTESEVNGYFLKEWEAAINRTEWFPGSKLQILPVIVNPEAANATSHYDRIPEKFRKYHFGLAPAGRMSDQLKSTLQTALRDLRRGGAA